MNVDELYNHITKNMTPEAALRNLLEGTIRTYEHLKFNEGEEIHPAMLVSLAALDMGWSIAIPNDNPDDDLRGMIIGTDDYIDGVLDSCHCDCGGDCECGGCCEH